MKPHTSLLMTEHEHVIDQIDRRHSAALDAEIKNLKAENETLRKDAIRWQWLREQYWIQEAIDGRLGDTNDIPSMEKLIDFSMRKGC
jgi:hypothetical protein